MSTTITLPAQRGAAHATCDAPVGTTQIEQDAQCRRSHVVGELAAVEATLRKIIPADLEERLLAQIPQWFLVLKLFKDLDVAFTRLDDRGKLEAKFRAVLTSILSLGENIFSGLEDRPDFDLSPLNYSRDVVNANLRYLREKYRRWYFPRNQEAAKATLAVIEGEAETSLR